MSNDNEKKPNQTSETPDESVKEEMETLATVFKEELDRTTQEAAQTGDDSPVIQPLDFDKDEETDEASGSTEKTENTEQAQPTKKPKTTETKKKKKKKRRTAAIVIPAVLCVFIMLFAVYAVFVCVTTDVDEMIGAIINAENADSDTDKLAFYETALEKCDTEDASYNSFIERINEQITLLTLSTKDYVNAYTYYKSASFPSLAAGKAPHYSEFNTFLAECDKIKTVGDNIYSTIYAASQDGTVKPEAAAVCTALGVPAYFSSTCDSLITSIYDAITAEKTGNYDTAATSYGEAITMLGGILDGIVSQELIERTVISYYNAGSIKEAVSFNDANIKDDMKATPKFTEYTDVMAQIESVGGYAAGLYTSVTKAIDADENADISEIVKSLGANENLSGILMDIAENIASGYKASKQNNNITGVYRSFGLASSSILDLGAVPDKDMLKLLVSSAFAYGSFEDANAIATDYFDAASLDNYDAIIDVYNSFYAAYEVWYNAYVNAYYYGGSFDANAVTASLDALITADSSASLTAFVSFVKYYTYLSSLQTEPTAEDYEIMLGYLNAAKTAYPDYTLFFNQYIISTLDDSGDFETAVKTSQESLAIDSGSDIANAHIAEQARRNGDIDASLAAALVGIGAYGDNTECARQAAIALMLKDDFEEAYKYIEICWDSSTIGYETLIAYDALYDGENEEIKNFLTSAVATIEEYSASNSFTYSDATKAIVSGSKSVADIFTADDFDLR